MITLHPYISEVDAYHLIPQEDQWIFNKLELCQRFGYGPCGPVGTWMPRGEYCIRPIINVAGMARGGFRKHTIDADRGILHKPYGYCWTPWTNALRSYRRYINDEWFSTRTVKIFKGGIEHFVSDDTPKELPAMLKGISRYLLVESLGDTIIDVGPRHPFMEMRQEVIDDYRTIDPEYQTPDSGHFGYQPRMARVSDGKWMTLEEIEKWV